MIKLKRIWDGVRRFLAEYWSRYSKSCVISLPCETQEPASGNSTYCTGKIRIIPTCKAIFVPAETNLCTYGAQSDPLKTLWHAWMLVLRLQ